MNFDFTHKLGENHKISFTGSTSVWDGNDINNLDELNTNELFDNGSVMSKLNFNKDNRNQVARFKIDYSRLLFSGNFETGIQYRIETRSEDFIFNNYKTGTNTWVRNDTFSYNLNYINSIYSGYLTYSGNVWGIGYKLGIRSEYFARNNDISTSPEPYEYNKFMFYPSVHLSKEINKKHQLQASYSRRIDRPQAYLLNSTPRYVDPRNIFIGSPYLIPEFTDAFELNYRTTVGIVSFSAQTYFRSTSNSFNALRLLQDDGIMHHQLVNSKNQQASGVELGTDIKLFKWWQISENINLFNYKLTTLVSNSDKVQTANSLDARIVNNFSLRKGMRIQATAYYRAPNVDAMGDASGFFLCNLAISQSFLKDKANISLSVNNLFQSDFVYKVKTEKFDNKYRISNESPIFMLNFSFSFNNYQNKQRNSSDDIQFKGGGAF